MSYTLNIPSEYHQLDLRSLPLPTFPLLGDYKLELWTPPPTSALLEKRSSKIPATAADLLSPDGYPIDRFWEMFEYCGGCRFIVAAEKMPEHVCDLT